MSASGLERATIRRLEPAGSTDEVTCMFNPKEYTFSRSNSWSLTPAKNTGKPKLEFSSGQPATMTMQLFFDTYGSGKPGSPPQDVRKHTTKIWDLMQVDPKIPGSPKNKKLGRPPKVQFQWGKAWSFEAVITSITLKFTMFDRTGVPVRATVDVTFQQAEDPKGFGRQNPTSGGKDGGTLWTVRDGDSLAWIAYREYGDSNLWRRIADANSLEDPRRLRPGMVLEIPDV